MSRIPSTAVRALAWSGICLGCSIAAGCSSDEESAGDLSSGVAGTGGAVLGAGGSVAGSGGSAGDAGSAGTGGGSAGRLYAFISVERWTRGEQVATMGGLVTFHQERPVPYVTRIDEHCVVHEEDWLAGGTSPPSYGTVSIDGLAGGTVVWEDGPEGPGFDASPDGFGEGDELTVWSMGGDVPAFAFTGTVPAVPRLTSHDNTVPGPGLIALRRFDAFNVAWDPVDGEVFVLFLQWTPVGFRMLHGLQCFFPGPEGAGAIPAAALERLLPSSEVEQTNFYFARIHRERRELAEVDIDFLLWNGRMTRIMVE